MQSSLSTEGQRVFNTPRTTLEKEIDERIAEIFELQDPKLITDLRVNNKDQPERFSLFLEECKRYINEKVETAVDDRRHDTVANNSDIVVHLASALSAHNLHSEVQKRCPEGTPRCPEGTPIPALQWLRLQFWPKRRNSAAASRYYGTIKVRYMIQSRQLRENHEDMHYASALFRYLKEFCVKFKENTTFVCMDDKAYYENRGTWIPCSCLERGKVVLVAKGTHLMVCYHDFAKLSMIPSVILRVVIPNAVEDSWYRGQACRFKRTLR